MDNYPMMSRSDWERAPFNEQEIPEETFEVTCSQSLSKTATVTTRNYVPGSCGENPDTSDTNWAEEWNENDHYTPLQLINLFRRFLADEINTQNHGYDTIHNNRRYLNHLIEECSEWVEDDVEYITD